MVFNNLSLFEVFVLSPLEFHSRQDFALVVVVGGGVVEGVFVGVLVLVGVIDGVGVCVGVVVGVGVK